MQSDNYSETLRQLENEELEVSTANTSIINVYYTWLAISQNTALGAEVYQKLMSIYLYQNKLYVQWLIWFSLNVIDQFIYSADAKLLWMRISDNLKEQNKELAQLNLLNLALQNNNYSDFFKHIKYEWSDVNKPIVNDLLGRYWSIICNHTTYLLLLMQSRNGRSSSIWRRLRMSQFMSRICSKWHKWRPMNWKTLARIGHANWMEINICYCRK